MRRIDTDIGSRAWDAASTATDAAKYRSRAIEVATMLRHSGLCQTLGYLASRTDENQRQVAEHIMAELRIHLPDLPSEEQGLAPSVVFLLAADRDTLSLATHRANIFADWLKRAVETLRHDRLQTELAMPAPDAAAP